MELRQKERRVFDFIVDYKNEHGCSPTYREIMETFGFRALSTVHQYLSQLASKGAIAPRGDNRKRDIEILPAAGCIPMLGLIPAGLPIETFEMPEEIEVPSSFLKQGRKHFALKVKGDSMIEEGIRDGDLIVIREQSDAGNGQTIVALIDGCESTLKKFFHHGDQVELRPANQTMVSLFLDPARLNIQGIVVGLLRKF